MAHARETKARLLGRLFGRVDVNGDPVFTIGAPRIGLKYSQSISSKKEPAAIRRPRRGACETSAKEAQAAAERGVAAPGGPQGR
jgi:hypothetical protein